MPKFIISLFAVSMMLLSTSCVVIRQGEVGVKRTLGRIQSEPITEGPEAFNPFSTVILRVPVRTENLEVKLPLPSKEGLTINSEISILYRVMPNSAPLLLQEIGTGYEQQIIMPVFRSAAADVTARFMAKDMHSGARSVIEKEISTRMNEILEPRGILIENVLMKSILLPAGLSRAIEEKLQAEQDAQRMEFVKLRETADAERSIIEAKGARDSQVIAADAQKRTLEIEAEGQAYATRLKANAEAEANAKIDSSLTDQVLRYRAIEAFKDVSNSKNSKLIITDGKTPFLGIPEGLQP
jgi:regulator of protease activity HflC (stomatin/prohibitin superfamily)